jgi:hypothetical protein
MGIIGFFMGYCEEACIKYMIKRKYKLDIKKLKENRVGILDKNFISSVMQFDLTSRSYKLQAETI